MKLSNTPAKSNNNHNNNISNNTVDKDSSSVDYIKHVDKYKTLSK